MMSYIFLALSYIFTFLSYKLLKACWDPCWWLQPYLAGSSIQRQRDIYSINNVINQLKSLIYNKLFV